MRQVLPLPSMWRIVLAFALVGCKDGSAPATVSSAPAHAAPEVVTTPQGPRPSLPPPHVEQPPVPPQKLAQEFDGESIDRFWKTNTEAEIRRRVPAANAIECHQTLCRITLAGSESDVTAQSEQLGAASEGDKHSLNGIVGSIVLTAPDKHADGTLELRAYARFEHPQ
jgi:hypothetical protein